MAVHAVLRMQVRDRDTTRTVPRLAGVEAGSPGLGRSRPPMHSCANPRQQVDRGGALGRTRRGDGRVLAQAVLVAAHGVGRERAACDGQPALRQGGRSQHQGGRSQHREVPASAPRATTHRLTLVRPSELYRPRRRALTRARARGKRIDAR
jgi:hypothetical protein